ncbi:MAG: hypothetical protein PUE83_12275 [Lachnobacterium sp.]|nr:hypothetical protein [Lachnobacterium sp.]
MNIIKKFKNATDKSKFGGIIYLIYFGLIIYVAVYLVLYSGSVVKTKI